MTASTDPLTHDASLDIGGLMRRLWQKKLWLVAVPALCTGAAWFALQHVEPRFRAQTDLYFKAADDVLSSGQGDAQGNTARVLDEQGIASQVEIMKSRRIAREVVERFDLAGRLEFNPDGSTSPLGGLREVLGLERPRSPSADTVLQTYYDNLNVYQANRARVVTVQFASTDPKLASEIPNAIASIYLAQQQNLKRGARPEQLDALRRELAGIKTKLEEAEAAVARAKAGAEVFEGRDGTLATQELSELVTELGRVRSQRARLEARASAIRRALRAGSLDSAPGISASPLIQRLRERLATLDSQIAELGTTLLSGHPRIRSLRSQRRNLSRQISREARNILRELQQDTAIALDREGALEREIERAKGESSRVRDEQVKLDALQREADAQRQLYSTYLLRFSEAESRAAREFVPADALVFSEARVPSEPYFPKTVPVLAGTAVGSLLLTMMIVLATGLGGAASAATPKPAPKPRKTKPAPAAKTSPPLAPTMASLSDATAPAPSSGNDNSVANVARALSEHGRGRVVMLSPEGEAGSRGTVLLARALARAGYSTVLLDLTGTGASSGLMRGLDRAKGFTDVVAGREQLVDCLHADPGSPLHVVPVGRSVLSDPQALAQTLDETLAVLDEAYGFVLVDCGHADAAALSRIATLDSHVVVNAPEGTTDAVRGARDTARSVGFDGTLELTPVRKAVAA